ncbi:hypothetical protein O3P69_006320 [Scylla paramamosain]|uniref:Uncharacterized protein n=1 Tax=Scylla paramamosain TaxID=85552 RepID=A0AAW0U3Q7_SCYPA
MSGFLLFTAVLMAGALLEAQAQVDFSFVEDFFNTQEESITKRLTDLKESMMLRGISSSALQDLADKGGIEIPERLINEFERIIIINMTDEEVISTIKEKMPKCANFGTESQSKTCQVEHSSYPHVDVSIKTGGGGWGR